MPSCLRWLELRALWAASRTFCTAGSSSPINTPMMAITTSSSTRVNALRGRDRGRPMEITSKATRSPQQNNLGIPLPQYLELQIQASHPLHRLLHQLILFALVPGEVRGGEAQERASVVPGHAHDRLLVDEELRGLFGVGEGAPGAGLR